MFRLVRNSHISYTNPMAFEQERIGERFTELIPQGDAAKVTSHLRDALQSGQANSQAYRLKVRLVLIFLLFMIFEYNI